MKTTVDAGAGFRYGLGLLQADAPCATIWGHNGDFIGYFDFAITSDAVDRQVVVMMISTTRSTCHPPWTRRSPPRCWARSVHRDRSGRAPVTASGAGLTVGLLLG
jgi:hypothetical protein